MANEKKEAASDGGDARREREDSWVLPVDKHYATLLRAMQEKADEFSLIHEAKIAEIYTIQSSRNSAWAVFRLTELAGCYIIFGVHTFGEFGQRLAEEGLLDEGVGIDLQIVLLESKVISTLTAVLENERLDSEFCPKCGHKLIMHTGCPGTTCPGCGRLGQGPGFCEMQGCGEEGIS